MLLALVAQRRVVALRQVAVLHRQELEELHLVEQVQRLLVQVHAHLGRNVHRIDVVRVVLRRALNELCGADLGDAQRLDAMRLVA